MRKVVSNIRSSKIARLLQHMINIPVIGRLLIGVLSLIYKCPKEIKGSVAEAASFVGIGYAYDFLRAYAERKVETIKLQVIALEENEPIVIAVIKNENHLIREHIEHYRKIGVRHFAYIDNGSRDGTLEFLSEQDDVSLFLAKDDFSEGCKTAWWREVTDILGYNRWYLKVDGDEFFAYPGMENIPITRFIDFLEEKNSFCIMAPFIDMYPKEPLFQLPEPEVEDSYDEMRNGGVSAISKHCYFDTDYHFVDRISKRSNLQKYGRYVYNSTKSRIHAEIGEDLKQCGNEYPLIKLSQNTIMYSHQNFPFSCSCISAKAFLLHYNYVSQLKYVSEQIKNPAFATKSLRVEVYNKNREFSFYHDRSQKYETSMDLMKIDKLIDREFFEEFLDWARRV